MIRLQGLRREHFLQDGEDGCECAGRYTSEPFHQPLTVDRAKLIDSHVSGPLSKAASHTPGVGLSPGRHRRDDHCPEMLIQLIRRDDQAGSCFSDFAATGRIEFNQIDVATGRWRVR